MTGARCRNTSNTSTSPKARWPKHSPARSGCKRSKLFPTLTLKVLINSITRLKTNCSGSSNRWNSNDRQTIGATPCHPPIHHPVIHQSNYPIILLSDEFLHRTARRLDHLVRSEEHTSELQSRQYLVCR